MFEIKSYEIELLIIKTLNECLKYLQRMNPWKDVIQNWQKSIILNSTNSIDELTMTCCSPYVSIEWKLMKPRIGLSSQNR